MKRINPLFCLGLATIAVFSIPAMAEIQQCHLSVGDAPGSDFATIAEALAAWTTGTPPQRVVQHGCTLWVQPGTYTAPLVLDEDLKLIATDGDPANTIIDGDGAAVAILIPDVLDDRVVIRGFTVRNANTGIDSQGERLHLLDIVVEQVTTGLRVAQSQRADVRRCRFNGGSDAGVEVLGVAWIENSVISGAGDCVRLGQSSYGIKIQFSTLTDCDVGVRNLGGSSYRSPDLRYDIVWGNATADLIGISCSDPTEVISTVTSQCCATGGNICEAPQFLQAHLGDYRLAATSPAVDAGRWPKGYFPEPNWHPTTDFDGPNAPRSERMLDGDGDLRAYGDLGAYEYYNDTLVPADIQNLRLEKLGGALLNWDPDPDVAASAGGHYNVYRGRIGDGGYQYFGHCYASSSSPSFFDPLPPPSGGVFYLVTGVSDLREGTMGYATGAERSNYMQCGTTKTVFVTSTVSNGDLGGIAGADATCNALASAAGFRGTFKAWLSDVAGGMGPADTFTRFDGPYLRVDGMTIADDWNDLVDGTLEGWILLDENGVSTSQQQSLVWTGTNQDGTPSTEDCGAWTNSQSSTQGRMGRSRADDSDWTDHVAAPCDTSAQFYCFEQ